jgi:hypothetical protein
MIIGVIDKIKKLISKTNIKYPIEIKGKNNTFYIILSLYILNDRIFVVFLDNFINRKVEVYPLDLHKDFFIGDLYKELKTQYDLIYKD